MSILSDIYNNVVPFTLLLGILVFVHELGHFLVARFNGVRVEVFSLGFGKKLLSFKKGDTTYCLSLIPLGGYVKMYGEQSADHIPDEDKKFSFTHKNVWQRISIVLAGPLMNYFFAVLVFAFIALTGEQTRAPKIAEVATGSLAEQAGLKSQDTVISVNDHSVRSYEEFQNYLNKFKSSTLSIKVQQEGEQPRTIKVDATTAANPNIFSTEKEIGQIEGLLSYAKGTLVAVKPDSTASQIGFKTGDEIIKLNGQKSQSWTHLNKLISGSNVEVVLERTSAEGTKLTETLQVPSGKTFSSLEEFGILNSDLYLEQVVPGSPADKAELKKYDRILAINSAPMTKWEDVLTTIKSYTGGEALEIKIEREGIEMVKKITPLMTSQMTLQGKEEKRFTIGIMPMANISQPELVVVQESNPFSALAKGVSRSNDITTMTVLSFVRLFQGEVSHKNVGGMLSIGKAAKDSYAMGAQSFLMTMAILSISLFILNLLPVPVLDGGHLVFYVIEIFKGSPLSGQKVEWAYKIGFALLMGLMFLSIFNDLTKFIFKA